MKKNIGFTLIELLAVIVILAIILAIAVPGISSIIEGSQINAFKSNERMLLKAAKTYVEINDSGLPMNVGDTAEISLTTLKTNKYISDIKSPSDTSKDCNGYVIITKIDNNKYDYTPHLNCQSNIGDSTADGLVGHWKLDGNAYDYTANNNHGILNGGITLGTGTDQTGKVGSATQFDGINDYINIDGVASFLPNKSLSIGLWVKAPSQSHKSLVAINTASGDNALLYMIYTNNKLGFYPPWDYGTVTIGDNQWHHVFFTYNHTDKIGKLFVDGKKDLEVSKNFTFLSNNLISIGQEFDSTTPSDFLTGLVSDVRIYNRVLSEEEVIQIYNITK